MCIFVTKDCGIGDPKYKKENIIQGKTIKKQRAVSFIVLSKPTFNHQKIKTRTAMSPASGLVKMAIERKTEEV